MQQLLRVNWPYGEEFIAFDEDDFRRQMTTTELRRDATEVTYNVDATFMRRGKVRTLELIYERSKQTDPIVRSRPLGENRYGSSVIRWISGETVGKAHWRDDSPGTDWDGDAEVSVLGGHPLEELEERAKKSVLVPLRPQQAALRNALLVLDEQCVLTGEKCRTALEAAHLVPVAQKGHEQIENGILLRADLHLLFDAGLIWFDVSDNHAEVKCSPEYLTDYYVRNLDGKLLPDKTFQRVKAALLKRARLPGGRGRDAEGQNL